MEITLHNNTLFCILIAPSFHSIQYPHQPFVQWVPGHADVVVRPSEGLRAPSLGAHHAIGNRRWHFLVTGARIERGPVRAGRTYAVQLRRFSQVDIFYLMFVINL